MERFSNLVLALYRASRILPITHFQEAALSLVKPLLGFDSCLWTTSWTTPAGMIHSVAHLYPGHPSKVGVSDGCNEQNPIMRVIRRMVEGQHCRQRLMLSPSGESGINIYVRRFGHRYCFFCTSQHRETGEVHGLAFIRSSQCLFSAQDKNLYLRLVPHLTETLTANRALALERLKVKDGCRHRVMAIANHKGKVHYLDAGFAALIQGTCKGWMIMLPPRTSLDALFHVNGYSLLGDTIGLERLVVDDALILRTRAKLSLDKLTRREHMVARDAAAGLSHKEIARHLGISPATVRNHIQAIHRKLNVHNTAELAAQLKLIEE